MASQPARTCSLFAFGSTKSHVCPTTCHSAASNRGSEATEVVVRCNDGLDGASTIRQPYHCPAADRLALPQGESRAVRETRKNEFRMEEPNGHLGAASRGDGSDLRQ